jgi:hypothetical protein
MSVFTDIHTHTERLDMSQDKRDIVDPNWDRIHKTHYAVESPNTVTSSYSTEETPSYNRTESYCNPHYDRPSKELVAAVFEDAKQVRKNALDNAKQALEEAFSNHPKLNTIKQKCDSEVVGSPEDITAYEEHVKTLGRDTIGRDNSASDKVKKQTEIHKNFVSKMANFPKHLSYEGSVVLCVLLSMSEVAYPNMSNLPMLDQTLIKTLVNPVFLRSGEFKVKFDNDKDFLLIFSSTGQGEFEMTMFNSVAHPRPEDLRDAGTGVVPIEKDGDKIAVGGKIHLNKKGIKRLIGVEPLNRNATVAADPQVEDLPRRQPVAGRNAFEIRSDVMQMALDYSVSSKSDLTPEEIVDVAKKFYQFVENRR